MINNKGCVITSESLIKVIVKFRYEKILCSFMSCIKLKVKKRITNWRVLQISYRLFQVHNLFGSWFVISEKIIKVHVFLWSTRGTIKHTEKYATGFLILLSLKLSSYGLVVFITINTYILTKDKFWIILERKLSIWFRQLLHIY